MAVAFLLIGLIFLIVSMRGTQKDFYALVHSDFSGPGNFIYWALAIWLVAAIGYYSPIKRLSNIFLLLVVLALFLSNRGFFNKFMDAIGATTATQLRDNRDLAGIEIPDILGGSNYVDKAKKVGGGLLGSVIGKVF